jgi:hypothetical protein
MDKNAVSQHQNVKTIPIATTKIHAPRMSVCQTTDSAEILLNVTIAMNAQPISAQLLLMEKHTLALILLCLAPKMLPFLILTSSCSLMMTKQNGSENATRTKVALLVSSMLNVTTTMDVPPTLALNNTVSAYQSTMLGVIQNWLVNQSTINLFLD